MKLFMAFLTFILALQYTCMAQEEQFKGQNQLKKCELLLKIGDYKKKKTENRALADSLKNVEIIWIYIDKETRKTKIPKPERVYLVSETLNSGVQVEYLVPADIYKSNTPKKTVFFPTWSAVKANKFYRADCYDSAMKR